MTLIEQTQKKDLIIIAVIHSDVPESTRKTIYADYFRPFVTELESFIERKVCVVFAGGEPYCNFDYKGEDVTGTLQRWQTLGYKLLHEMNEEGLNTEVYSALTKIILVTRDKLNDAHAGVALNWSSNRAGQFAIASLTGYQVVGHEMGHLLGAKHEDSEVQFNGWIADTYMAPTNDKFKANTYTFSHANRQNIKSYLADKD
ncbi:hypothetical protein J2W17_002726 [Pseudomonas lini]|jgi:hypothetical protein|uniref:reprolysin-like metallopeptidase n=1 Tax=Pseudomonas lini TaxID=163011 RepID=UPI00277FFC13|nr:hypothetical protein [Pseudomonas lini]MDQ0123779.1 hypothetical protein [Pseudomonas lini]